MTISSSQMLEDLGTCPFCHYLELYVKLTESEAEFDAQEPGSHGAEEIKEWQAQTIKHLLEIGACISMELHEANEEAYNALTN